MTRRDTFTSTPEAAAMFEDLHGPPAPEDDEHPENFSPADVAPMPDWCYQGGELTDALARVLKRGWAA